MPPTVCWNWFYIRGHFGRFYKNINPKKELITYITSAEGLGGWVKKMVSFADIKYCTYADKVGGVLKGQKYADVI